MRGFFVYEEYSAKYELVSKDLNQLRRSSWNSWEKGCEMLAGAINSPDIQREYGKRALTLDDMLVKVCGLSNTNRLRYECSDIFS